MVERRIRLRTAANDKRKALDHYQDLRRTGKVSRAVVIAEAADGEVTILGQMLTPDQIAELLLIAANAMAHMADERNKPTFEAHEEPHQRGVPNQGRPRARKVTTDAEGLMVPPPGENLISCGECNHPRWYLFHTNDEDRLARYACAHCGNEVEAIPIFHAEGRA